MSDAPQKRSRAWINLAAAAVVLFLVYPLSYGPALRILERGGYDPPAPPNRFYAPLVWACNHSRTVAEFVAWQGELWMKRRPPVTVRPPAPAAKRPAPQKSPKVAQ